MYTGLGCYLNLLLGTGAAPCSRAFHFFHTVLWCGIRLLACALCPCVEFLHLATKLQKHDSFGPKISAGVNKREYEHVFSYVLCY